MFWRVTQLEAIVNTSNSTILLSVKFQCKIHLWHDRFNLEVFN